MWEILGMKLATTCMGVIWNSNYNLWRRAAAV